MSAQQNSPQYSNPWVEYHPYQKNMVAISSYLLKRSLWAYRGNALMTLLRRSMTEGSVKRFCNRNHLTS